MYTPQFLLLDLLTSNTNKMNISTGKEKISSN